MIQQKIQVIGEKLIPVAYFVQHKPNTDWRGTIVRGDGPATDSSTLARIEFSSPGTQMSAKHTSVQMECAGQSRVRIPGRERDFPEVSLSWDFMQRRSVVFFTDVSGQHIGSILKGQAAQQIYHATDFPLHQTGAGA
jgi:hypothetical protein